MNKVALITGITGQDGSFLAEFLLDKGYDVHGTIRRSSVDYRERIAHLEGLPHFHLHYADLGDSMSILQVVKIVQPDEIYNLAAQSHVQVSFDSPENQKKPAHEIGLQGYKFHRVEQFSQPAECSSNLLNLHNVNENGVNLQDERFFHDNQPMTDE